MEQYISEKRNESYRILIVEDWKKGLPGQLGNRLRCGE